MRADEPNREREHEAPLVEAVRDDEYRSRVGGDEVSPAPRLASPEELPRKRARKGTQRFDPSMFDARDSRSPLGCDDMTELLDRAGAGVWSATPEGEVKVSHALGAMHGLPLGMRASGLVDVTAFFEHLEDVDRGVVLEGLVRATVNGFATFEYRWPSEDGSHRFFKACALARLTRDGALSQFHGMVEEVTAQREVEARLERAREEAVNASRIKSRFLANMSHEIRTPMNAVLGMTRLLMDTRLDAEQREYLTAVETSGEALLSLINDVLDISKIEAGKFSLDSGVLRPDEVLFDTVRLLASRAHEKGVEVIIDIDPTAQNIECDGDSLRFRQIVTNVIGNAVKFTYAGQVVVQASVDEGKRLHIVIEDTGVGIPPNLLAAIFEPFRQVNGETTRVFGGTGLGLSIARELVTLMNGTIAVTSQEERGSRFVIEIPLGAVRPRSPSAAPQKRRVGARTLTSYQPPPLDTDVSGRRVGVLCRSGILEQSLANGLRRLGAAVTEFRDPATLFGAAISITSEEALDFVIDQDLDGQVRGIDLARRIKSLPGVASVTLLVRQTARFPEEDLQLAGVASAVRKPLRVESLAGAIKAARAVPAAVELVSLPAKTRSRTSRAPTSKRSPRTQTPPALTPEPVRSSRAPKVLDITPPTPPVIIEPKPVARILVAEDDDINARLTCALVKKFGLVPVRARNGREAVEMSALEPFELVLMDLHMPELDGMQATALIREREAKSSGGAGAAPHLPIIALTANVMRGESDRCIAGGMDDYLSKPIKPATLHATLEKWCDATVSVPTNSRAGVPAKVAAHGPHGES